MGKSDSKLRRRRPKRSLSIKAAGVEAEQVPLNGHKQLVTLTGMEIDQESMKRLQEALGDDTLVLCLPKGAKLEVIDLVEPSTEPGTLGHRPAEWDF